MDNWGNWVLSAGGAISAIFVAWLTARGANAAARTEAEVKTDLGRETNSTEQVRILLEQYKGLAETYQLDRAEDARSIAALKEEGLAWQAKLEEKKRREAKYRTEMRRLRSQIFEYGGDPGPWPEELA